MMLLYRRNPVSLLDNSPLRDMLERNLDFERIQGHIDSGALYAVCVTASGYTTGQSVSFFQGGSGLEGWERNQRIGAAVSLKLDYLLASAALPFIFPAVKVHREYFGDGSMRQIAPVSPALHLGADRVLIVGTGRQTVDDARARSNTYPSLAQIAGHALNSIFLDSLSVDIERLERINRTVKLIPPEKLAESQRAPARGQGAVHHARRSRSSASPRASCTSCRAPCASCCGPPARSIARARTWRATCCSRNRSAARSSTWATRTPSPGKPKCENSSAWRRTAPMADPTPPQDPFEMFRRLWGPLGIPLPGMAVPTFDPQEVEKRIAELKSVEAWLNMNLNMLKLSINGLEMQRAALQAMKSASEPPKNQSKE